MKDKLNLYGKVFRYILFPFYESILRRRDTLRYLDEANRVLEMSPEDVLKLQWQSLKELLNHAYENVPYYRKTWDEIGVKPDDINSMDDYYKLPVLTKEIVRKEYNDLIAMNHLGTSKKKSTGGSTGQPFSYEYNFESHKRREAIAMRGYGLAGAGLGVKTWQLWGQDLVHPGYFKSIKNKLFHRFYNRKICNSFEMTKDNIPLYIEEYNRFKPSAIVSYTSPLVQLATYILENNLDVHQPDTILTGAEPLYEFQRKLIEKAFESKVYNTYGCREVMLIASESESQDGLHINADHLVVEVVDSNNLPIIEKTGPLLITDLSNYAMPLIRYENGDQAILKGNQSDSHLPLPMLRSIEGRKLDVIQTPDGKLLPGEFFPHLLKDFDGIEKFQIIQKVVHELNISIVKSKNFTNDKESKIAEIIRHHLGDSISLNFHYVNEIPLTASGKFRVTISELKS